MLGVFTLAIVPWSIFHQHRPVPHIEKETVCTHKLHLSAQQDDCLICKAHFEKHYTLSKATVQVFLTNETLAYFDFNYHSGYVMLVATALRGPPLHA